MQLKVLLVVGVCVGLLASSARATVFTYGVFGDAGITGKEAKAVRTSLQESKIRDIVMVGDNLYDLSKSYEEVWDVWKTNGFEFGVVALGNHNKSYASEMSYFGMPSEFYAKSNGVVRFVVLNSDNRKNVATQMQFLEKELQNATENFIFLVYHHPTYNVSSFHIWQDKKEFQLAIRPLLAEYKSKITAVLLGHDHVSSLVDVSGQAFVISGAIHDTVPSPPVNYWDGSTHIETKWMYRGGAHWTRLDVNDGEQSVWLNFVNAEAGQVSCSARIYPAPWVMRPNCTEDSSSHPHS